MKKTYLVSILFLLSGISLCIGAGGIWSLKEIAGNNGHMILLIHSRLPRLVSLIIAGVGMSICGLIMQHLSQNRFVSPSIAGTADSAKLGVLMAILIFPTASITQKMLLSFLCALMGTYVFMKLTKGMQGKKPYMVPLAGMMLGGVIDAFATFVAYQNDLVQNMASWLQADFSTVMKGSYELLYLSIPLLVIAYLYAHHFTIAGAGKVFSKNLGLNYEAIMRLGLIIVAFITAIVVIVAGKIPFLGIVVPNLVALRKGDHLKKNIVTTAILGACLLLICDIVSRLIIFPYEIPIGVTVSVIGSLLFLYLLMKEARR